MNRSGRSSASSSLRRIGAKGSPWRCLRARSRTHAGAAWRSWRAYPVDKAGTNPGRFALVWHEIIVRSRRLSRGSATPPRAPGVATSSGLDLASGEVCRRSISSSSHHIGGIPGRRPGISAGFECSQLLAARSGRKMTTFVVVDIEADGPIPESAFHAVAGGGGVYQCGPASLPISRSTSSRFPERTLIRRQCAGSKPKRPRRSRMRAGIRNRRARRWSGFRIGCSGFRSRGFWPRVRRRSITCG